MSRKHERAGRKGGFSTTRKLGPKNLRYRAHLGGTARMAKLTPEQRSELGRKAIHARYAKQRLEKALAETGEPPLDDDLVT